jgi:hypothetical protein
VSGTKASNQQRTTKRAMELITKQMMEVKGTPTMYATGWNAALMTALEALARGEHLHPPAPAAPNVGKSHMERLDQAIAVGLSKTEEAAGQCGARDGDGPPCIHPKAHVEAGQPLHSNGRRTWRTPR